MGVEVVPDHKEVISSDNVVNPKPEQPKTKREDAKPAHNDIMPKPEQPKTKHEEMHHEREIPVYRPRRSTNIKKNILLVAVILLAAVAGAGLYSLVTSGKSDSETAEATPVDKPIQKETDKEEDVVIMAVVGTEEAPEAETKSEKASNAAISCVR